eukprot:353438-Chlamydomonas_euryale.AAC.9
MLRGCRTRGQGPAADVAGHRGGRARRRPRRRPAATPCGRAGVAPRQRCRVLQHGAAALRERGGRGAAGHGDPGRAAHAPSVHQQGQHGAAAGAGVGVPGRRLGGPTGGGRAARAGAGDGCDHRGVVRGIRTKICRREAAVMADAARACRLPGRCGAPRGREVPRQLWLVLFYA